MPDDERKALDRDATTEQEASRTQAQDLDPQLTEAVLGLVAEGGMAGETLGPDPASIELLLPAAQVAVGFIVWHGKTCRRPKTCQDTPPPLRNLLTMREATVARQLGTIARALIQFPQFPMVQHTKEHWLKHLERDESDARLIGLVDDGTIFTRDGLLDFLDGDADKNARVLGTTLWARGFTDPRAYALFRTLGPLAHDGAEPEQQVSAEPADVAPKPDRRARRQERREVKELGEKLKTANRERRKALDDLANEVRKREEAVSDLEAAEAERATQQKALEEAQRELRFANGRVASAQGEAQRIAAATQRLREAVTAADGARQELELARNRAVRELSIKNKQIEALTAEIAATPKGADAVHAFLEAEAARIAQDRMISQGADRQRADARHTAHRKLEQAFHAAYPAYIAPRPLAVAPRERMEFEVLGGGDEVGRSAYLLRIGAHTMLIDCGIKIGRKHLEEWTPDLSALDRVDSIILTHAHTDHLGWIPAVARAFPDVSIHCTTETSELAPIMLDDAYHHHSINMHRLSLEREHSADPEPTPETYEREDVDDVKFRLFGCDFREKVTLPGSEIQVRFLRAGHILGAASVLIEAGGRRVLLSGDISSEAQYTIGTADWSDALEEELDLLVLESTYGATNREPLASEQEKLVDFVKRASADGGSVILPCFGLGRGQEVALVLARAMESNDLPRLPVWIDGMIRSINSVYRDYQPLFQLPDNFIEVASRFDRVDVLDQANREPVLIVTTSGMLAGGPAVEYAQKLLPDPKNRIAFTGYQDEGNPGHELLRLTEEGTRVRTITVAGEDGQGVEIRAAAPARKFGLSAHADQRGLLEYATAVRARHIALVHGFTQTQEPLRDRLLSNSPDIEVSLGSARRIAFE